MFIKANISSDQVFKLNVVHLFELSLSYDTNQAGWVVLRFGLGLDFDQHSFKGNFNLKNSVSWRLFVSKPIMDDVVNFSITWYQI